MRAVVLAGVLLGSLLSSTAEAHSMPGSAVYLDVREGSVEAELQLPIAELEYGFGSRLADDPARRLEEHRAALARYLMAHVQVREPRSGAAWRVEVIDQRHSSVEERDELWARLRLTPPPGASLRAFDLRYDAILHEVRSHRALIFLRSDVDDAAMRVGAASSPEPHLLALLQLDRTQAAVRLGRPAHPARRGGPGELLLLAGAIPLMLVAWAGLPGRAARQGRWWWRIR